MGYIINATSLPSQFGAYEVILNAIT